MAIEELYEAIGSDYNEVIGRLRSEEMIKKFVSVFPSDENYKNFSAAYKNGDFEAAFRAVHTLKGLSLNLGFDKLAKACIPLTEALRGGKNEVTPKMLTDLNTAYNELTEVIPKFL